MESRRGPSSGCLSGISRGGQRVALLALCSIAGLACCALEFGAGSVVSLRDFKTQGRSEQGARWFLDGQSAVIRGTVYELTGVVLQVEDDNGRTAVVRAQACTYHQDSGLVESNAAVRVETGDITMDGVGFDMLVAERRIRIRDAVRMEVPGAKANLGAFSPRPSPANQADAPTDQNRAP